MWSLQSKIFPKLVLHSHLCDINHQTHQIISILLLHKNSTNNNRKDIIQVIGNFYSHLRKQDQDNIVDNCFQEHVQFKGWKGPFLYAIM